MRVLCGGDAIKRSVKKTSSMKQKKKLNRVIDQKVLRIKDLIDCCSWHVIEEKAKEDGQQKHQRQFEDDPLVVLPQDELNGFEWIGNPEERTIRTTEEQRERKKTKDR